VTVEFVARSKKKAVVARLDRLNPPSIAER
jgi:hypothetical protein